jgi:transcriptional regulator with XRE-family HTH domain
VTITKKFGKYLKKRRLAQKWVLRALADKSGIPFPTLHSMERGLSDPRLSNLVRLAKAFGESLTTFLAPIEPKKKEPEA